MAGQSDLPLLSLPPGLWLLIEASEMRKTLSYKQNELESVFTNRPFHGSSSRSSSHSKLLYSWRFLSRTPSFPMFVPPFQPLSSITLPQIIRSSGVAKAEKDVGYYVGFLVRAIVLVYLVSEWNTNNRYPLNMLLKPPQQFIFVGFPIV